jgi:hypothetical protein
VNNNVSPGKKKIKQDSAKIIAKIPG